MYLPRLFRWVPAPVARVVAAGGEELTERLGGPARRRAVILLASVLGLSAADAGAVGAMAPQLEAAFHIGNLDIGILLTVSSLVGALTTLPMGVLTDRSSRTHLLTVSILVWGVAEAVSGVAVSFVMLLLIRLALGAVTATAGPAVSSLTGDLFPARERSRIYSYILTGELLGSGAGLLVSGDVASAISWRAGFVVLAVPSVAVAWAIHRMLPEPARGGQSTLHPGDLHMRAYDEVASGSPDLTGERDTEGDTERDSALIDAVHAEGVEPDPGIVIRRDPSEMSLWDALRWVLKVRTNVLLIVSSSLGYFFFAGLKTFAVIFSRGQYRISQSLASLLAVVVGAAAIAGILAAGRVSDRLLAGGRLDARLVVGAVGYLGASVLFVPAVLTHDLALALPLVLLAAVALSGPNAPGDAARLDVVPSRMWGRAEAIRTFLRSLLEASAPLLFGLVSQLFGSSSGGFGAGVNSKAAKISAASAHGLSDAFLVMLAPLALSGVFLLVARRSYPTDVASAAESDQAVARRP